MQKTNQKEFRIEKVIKRKGDKFYVKWKGYNNFFKSWIDEKDMWANVKNELDLSNYVTKTDLKNASGVDTSSFAKKTDSGNVRYDVDELDIDKLKIVPINLSNLKSKLDKLDIDNLVPVPFDLSKLWYIKNDVVKETEYNKLVKKLIILVLLILVIQF